MRLDLRAAGIQRLPQPAERHDTSAVLLDGSG
jgi:hypothetical protein